VWNCRTPTDVVLRVGYWSKLRRPIQIETARFETIRGWTITGVVVGTIAAFAGVVAAVAAVIAAWFTVWPPH
jgi:hypothetical protein